jgi:small-conductance mechanosensitive channel
MNGCANGTIILTSGTLSCLEPPSCWVIFISFLLSFFVRKKTGEENRFRLGQSLLRHLVSPVSFFVPLLVFNNLLPLLQADRAIRSQLVQATEIALIIVFACLLVRSIHVAQDIVHHKVNINTANNLRQRQIITQLIYICRVLTIIIIVLAVGVVLLTFDTLRKIGTGLLTGVGIGGIIIGFAAQHSLANLMAGFQIAFTQPIRIDDEVVVKGEFGKI